MNRTTILYRMMFSAMIIAAIMASALTVTIGVADPIRIEVVFRGLPVGVIQMIFTLFSATMFGFGLWFWVAEERILHRTY